MLWSKAMRNLREINFYPEVSVPKQSHEVQVKAEYGYYFLVGTDSGAGTSLRCDSRTLSGSILGGELRSVRLLAAFENQVCDWPGFSGMPGSSRT